MAGLDLGLVSRSRHPNLIARVEIAAEIDLTVLGCPSSHIYEIHRDLTLQIDVLALTCLFDLRNGPDIPSAIGAQEPRHKLFDVLNADTAGAVCAKISPE